MPERDIIEQLRRIATHPAARGLQDDAALFEGMVITHDSIAEGVHFLSGDPAADVAWKLVAVNLSDLAAKGARPEVALLSFSLSGDDAWDAAFVDGIGAACEQYGLALIGGDTIALPEGAPRVFGLTAIGRAGARTPSRAGAKPGDRLWLAGTLGDSAAGLALLQQDSAAVGALVDSYRRPLPLLEMGQALAPQASATMDVSDGLLLDLQRLCAASGCGAEVELEALPLSDAFVAERGQDRAARLFAASGGDDYALLAAFAPDVDPAVTFSLPRKPTLACIGKLVAGDAIVLTHCGEAVPLPERLGYEHRTKHPPLGDRG